MGQVRIGIRQSRGGDFLAVGAPDPYDPKVYVYRLDDLTQPYKVIEPPLGMVDDDFGWSLAFGDMNGDGYADLAVGAPNVDVIRVDLVALLGPGRVAVFSGHDDWTTVHG